MPSAAQIAVQCCALQKLLFRAHQGPPVWRRWRVGGRGLSQAPRPGGWARWPCPADTLGLASSSSPRQLGTVALPCKHPRFSLKLLVQACGAQSPSQRTCFCRAHGCTCPSTRHHKLEREPTCALSSSMCAARSASAAFPLSTFFAKRALDCVYSCPQNTAVLGGSSRSFASDCSSTARLHSRM